MQREPAGLTPVLETRIIEATEVVLQRKASEAALAQEAALLELNQLRGQPPNAKLRIEAPSLEFAPAPDLVMLLAAARTNNFELRMRQAELEQQGFKVELARKEKYQAFTVEPYFSREQAVDTEVQAGIGLFLPRRKRSDCRRRGRVEGSGMALAVANWARRLARGRGFEGFVEVVFRVRK